MWPRWLALGLAFFVICSVCFGVITAPRSLKIYLSDAEFVVMTKVDKLFPEKPAMVLTVAEDLKGKTPFRRLPINLSGDSEAQKEKHVPALLKRLAPDLP